jgi:Protein of unknown function (DUF3047)
VNVGRAARAAVACAVCGISLAAEPDPILEVGNFSAEHPGTTLPAGWRPLMFDKIKRHTTYTLVHEDHTVVVKAVADASASGLIRDAEIDPRQWPILQWRWKVSNVLSKGNPKRKDGDDYPARLYVTFKYDPAKVSALQRAKYGAAKLLYGQYPPHAGLNYIWETKLPKETIVPNAYTERLRMIVVESGSENLNRWMTYDRNIYEDYKAAFGEEPPAISGIAIMTDTDNTGETASAFYGDIRFKHAGNH